MIGCDGYSGGSGGLHELRTKRPNIYNMVVVVMRLMLLNHEKCLMDVATMTREDNCPFEMIVDVAAGPGDGAKDPGPSSTTTRSAASASASTTSSSSSVGHVLLNEEEVTPNSIVKEYGYYHPLMHKTIETLIKCVYNGSSHTSIGKNESKILYAIAAAFSLRCSVVSHEFEPVAVAGAREKRAAKSSKKKPSVSVDSVVVVDAKLCSFATFQFSEITDHIIKMTKQSFRGDDVDAAAKDISAAIIQNFILDQPLLPVLGSNQAGLFISPARGAEADPRLESSDEKGWRNGFFLALFLRVFLLDEKNVSKSIVSGTPMELVRTMLSVAQTCYAVKKDGDLSGSGRKR